MKILRSNDFCDSCAAVSRGDRSVQHRRLHNEGALPLSQYLVSTLHDVGLAHDISEGLCGSFSLRLSFFPLPLCTLIYSLSCHPIFPLTHPSQFTITP